MAGIVLVTETQVTVISVGEVGPQGPPGPAGGASQTYIAGMALGGQRAVVLNSAGEAVYADNTDLSHADKVLGITTGAASIGNPVTVQTLGPLTEPSWTWALDQEVFLSTVGLLTQTPPSSGFLEGMGFPLATDTLQVRIKPPVRLEG